MPKYIIEREIPGAGSLTAHDLQGISQKSCGILNEMGPKIQWLESALAVNTKDGWRLKIMHSTPTDN